MRLVLSRVWMFIRLWPAARPANHLANCHSSKEIKLMRKRITLLFPLIAACVAINAPVGAVAQDHPGSLPDLPLAVRQVLEARTGLVPFDLEQPTERGFRWIIGAPVGEVELNNPSRVADLAPIMQQYVESNIWLVPFNRELSPEQAFEAMLAAPEFARRIADVCDDTRVTECNRVLVDFGYKAFYWGMWWMLGPDRQCIKRPPGWERCSNGNFAAEARACASCN